MRAHMKFNNKAISNILKRNLYHEISIISDAVIKDLYSSVKGDTVYNPWVPFPG